MLHYHQNIKESAFTSHIHPNLRPAAATNHLSTPPSIFSLALAAPPVNSLGEADVGGDPTVEFALVVVLGTNELCGGSDASDEGGGELVSDPEEGGEL
jgi:hypothetical protein